MSPRTTKNSTARIWLWLCALAILLPLLAGSSAVIPCLSGFVRDPNGNPVEDADLDFTNSLTGQRLITPGDNTDAFGFYNVCVLPGIYDVSFAPPPGSRLMGRLLRDVDLSADVGQELDMTLQFGTVVSGTITDPVGGPVGEVDVDVDAVGGGRIYTPDDNSDPATGNYRVVVPDGLYRLRFEPPLGSRLRGAEFDSVTVAGDLVQDMSLVEGVLLTGRVRDTTGAGIPEVDVDLRQQATGAKVFIANNTTDTAGDYSVAVPGGTFELRFSPPRGSRYVAEAIGEFVIDGDRAQDAELEQGLIVSFTVQDAVGDPISGVDIDVKIPSTGEKLFTPHDKTDGLGTTDIAVLPSTYTLQFDPPLGTTFDRVVLPAVVVQADTTIVVPLPEVSRVSATGRVVDARGAGIGGASFDAQLRPGGANVFIPVDDTDAEGFFDLSIPMGTYDVFVSPLRGMRFVGRKLENVTASRDSTWGEIVLDDGWQVTLSLTTGTGLPVAGADLDLVNPLTGHEIFTPYDNSDAAGLITVFVPAGTYRLVVTPAAGSSLAPLIVDDFTVSADTSGTLTLTRAAPDISGLISLQQNYPNPFNAETTVPYVLAQPADISVSVYDLAGRLVRVLEKGPHEAAAFTTNWDGTDAAGAPAASGIYFLQLRTTQGKETRKMALVR